MSKIGRNDLCICGSGKKYKKCCMMKEANGNREMTEERVEVDFAGRANVPKISTEIRGYGIFEGIEKELEYAIEKGLDGFERRNSGKLDGEYLSNIRYVKEFGYPLTKYDFLSLEMINLAGFVILKEEAGRVEGLEEILVTAGKRLKKTEKYVIDSIKTYKDVTGKNMDYEAKLDFKSFDIEKEILPANMRKENVINFLYANIGLSLHEVIANEIEKKYGKKKADKIGNEVFHFVMNYISDNCIVRCKNKCIKNMEQSGYCDICKFGRKKLSCPKEDEIGYNEIKATEKDMDKH